MIKNNLKIAFRNLFKNKLYSLINIGGLGVGMAVSFMLLLYVYNEFTFDKFYKNDDRIYSVLRNQPSNGEIQTSGSISSPVAAAMVKDFPEVEKAARTTWHDNHLFKYQDKSLNLPMLSADPALLDIFAYEFVKGSRATAFMELSSIVLTETGAKTIFGNDDPMGKIVKIDNTRNAKVTGVIKDLPANSSRKFQALGSWAMLEADMPWVKTNASWGNFNYRTYALVKPGTDIKKLNAKLAGLITKNNPEDKENKLMLSQFSRGHLYSEFKNGVSVGGAISYVRLFLMLAIGILLIACINFMNLSTARSENRAREVGVRKVVGASRFSIIWQFMGESLLMACISFVVALLIIGASLDYFNGIIHKSLAIPYGLSYFWIAGLGITLITGIIAGSYPALFLSSFKPVKVLKGINNAGKATLRPRQILVIVQFAFATCLIVSTMLIYKQLNYIKNLPVGYDKDGLVELSLIGKVYDQFESFRRDAIEAGAITEGSSTSGSITNDGSSSWGITWPGQLPGEDKLPISQMVTTYHFTKTFDIKVLEGRDFDMGRPSDSTAIMLNQSAVKLMRLKDPLGTIVYWQGAKRTVVGVVQDFIWGRASEPVSPVIIGYMKGWAGAASLRLNKNVSVSDALAKLQTVYKKYNAEYPFEYKFVDELYSEKFSNEQLLGTLTNSFTVLAIVISCLGLFGLASFSAEQRRKEIGIRKVLGASIANLWLNLSKEFMVLVTIAFLIGSAFSVYIMSQWLQNYTFRTNISIWVFAATITISLAVTLITVSWQAVKAAITNPVKNLRSE
ncbi:FtsX-like permease family protein [Mucilaginibacter sp.]|uniref:ABC transporter permease n=1 Tax=Mucilaginibacter sp. TaxID=1882438 RepID=UPI0032648C34